MTETAPSQEVFRGHWDQCFDHFVDRFIRSAPRNAKGSQKAKEPIAAFCGVKSHTITRWIYEQGVKPVGDVALKLMCFLDIQGYRIIELERKKPLFRGLLELIGYGILSAQKVAMELGYTEASRVYGMLRGDFDPTGEKKEKILKVWAHGREELGRVKEERRKEFHLNLPSDGSVSSHRSSLRTVPVALHDNDFNPHEQAGISVMQGLLALFEAGLFSDLSNGNANRLQRASGKAILRLSSYLSALSSKLMTPGNEKGDDVV